MQVHDFIHKLRDSVVEKEIANQLKLQSPEEQYRFITELSNVPHSGAFAVSMWLAKTCLKDKHYLEKLLVQGFERGDVSTIKHWIKAVIDRLGFRRVVNTVIQRMHSDPETALRCRYWLRQLVPIDNKLAVETFNMLDQGVELNIQQDPTIIERISPYHSLPPESSHD